MTYLNEHYGIVKFEKSQNYKISEVNGIYKIVALPITFKSNNEELIKNYLTFFKEFSINFWETEIKSNTSFNNSQIIVDLNKTFQKEMEKIISKGIDWDKEDDNFDVIKKLVHFLPPLYIGKAKDQSVKARFTQHLNYQNEKALINRIEKEPIFKKCYKLFIWLEIEKEFIDAIESFLIQTSNPIFNRQRS